MKIKTTQRNTTNQILQAVGLKNEKLTKIQQYLFQLVKAQREVEREMDERKLPEPGSPSKSSAPVKEVDGKVTDSVCCLHYYLIFLATRD
jgi:hypothetical protein